MGGGGARRSPRKEEYVTSMDFRMDKSAGRRSGQKEYFAVDDPNESEAKKRWAYRLQHPPGTADDRPPLEERGSSL